MKTTLLTLLVCVAFGSVFAQTAGLNGINANGKKDGRWLVYLDAKGAKVDDSTLAVYKRYTWFDDGVNTQPMGWLAKKGGKIEGAAAGTPGKPALLDGVYKAYNKDGKLFAIHNFKNGEYLTYEEFDKKGGKVALFDYISHCDANEHSWKMYYNYDLQGRPKLMQCITKGTNGKWPKMKG